MLMSSKMLAECCWCFGFHDWLLAPKLRKTTTVALTQSGKETVNLHDDRFNGYSLTNGLQQATAVSSCSSVQHGGGEGGGDKPLVDKQPHTVVLFSISREHALHPPSSDDIICETQNGVSRLQVNSSFDRDPLSLSPEREEMPPPSNAIHNDLVERVPTVSIPLQTSAALPSSLVDGESTRSVDSSEICVSVAANEIENQPLPSLDPKAKKINEPRFKTTLCSISKRGDIDIDAWQSANANWQHQCTSLGGDARVVGENSTALVEHHVIDTHQLQQEQQHVAVVAHLPEHEIAPPPYTISFSTLSIDSYANSMLTDILAAVSPVVRHYLTEQAADQHDLTLDSQPHDTQKSGEEVDLVSNSVVCNTVMTTEPLANEKSEHLEAAKSYVADRSFIAAFTVSDELLAETGDNTNDLQIEQQCSLTGLVNSSDSDKATVNSLPVNLGLVSTVNDDVIASNNCVDANLGTGNEEQQAEHISLLYNSDKEKLVHTAALRLSERIGNVIRFAHDASAEVSEYQAAEIPLYQPVEEQHVERADGESSTSNIYSDRNVQQSTAGVVIQLERKGKVSETTLMENSLPDESKDADEVKKQTSHVAVSTSDSARESAADAREVGARLQYSVDAQTMIMSLSVKRRRMLQFVSLDDVEESDSYMPTAPTLLRSRSLDSPDEISKKHSRNKDEKASVLYYLRKPHLITDSGTLLDNPLDEEDSLYLFELATCCSDKPTFSTFEQESSNIKLTLSTEEVSDLSKQFATAPSLLNFVDMAEHVIESGGENDKGDNNQRPEVQLLATPSNDGVRNDKGDLESGIFVVKVQNDGTDVVDVEHDGDFKSTVAEKNILNEILLSTDIDSNNNAKLDERESLSCEHITKDHQTSSETTSSDFGCSENSSGSDMSDKELPLVLLSANTESHFLEASSASHRMDDEERKLILVETSATLEHLTHDLFVEAVHQMQQVRQLKAQQLAGNSASKTFLNPILIRSTSLELNSNDTHPHMQPDYDVSNNNTEDISGTVDAANTAALSPVRCIREWRSRKASRRFQKLKKQMQSEAASPERLPSVDVDEARILEDATTWLDLDETYNETAVSNSIADADIVDTVSNYLPVSLSTATPPPWQKTRFHDFTLDIDSFMPELGPEFSSPDYDDEWLDDDVIGIKRLVNGNSQVYSEKANAPTKVQRSVIRSPEAKPKMKVPEALNVTVDELLSRAVDILWERRRYGELWDNLAPPASYMAAGRSRSDSINGADNDNSESSHSLNAFKTLIFELAADTLREVFEDELYVDYPPWMQTKPTHQHMAVTEYFPLSSARALKPYVRKQVCAILELPSHPSDVIVSVSTSNSALTSASRAKSRRMSDVTVGKDRFLSCRRSGMDLVDRVLVRELWQSEREWFDYGEDELDLKMWVAESIWHSLLHETALIAEDSHSYKYSQASYTTTTFASDIDDFI